MDVTGRGRPVLIDSAPWFGGAQRSLLALATGLQRAGRDPLVLAADGSAHGLLACCRAAGLETVPFRARHWRHGVSGLWQYLQDRRRFRRVWQEVRGNDAQRLIVHANGARAGLLLIDGRSRPLPLLLHARDLRIPAIAQRRLAAAATRVLAVSECVAASWRPLTDGVRVIPNPFDTAAVAATVPAPRPWAAPDLLVAVLVADMVKWKRHDLFLDALHAVRQAMPGWRGLVVGRSLTRGGSRLLRRLRRRAATLALTPYIRFITDADDALPWLATADVAISTARAEPFGRTIVEALALGKPVVATRGWGPEEILSGCPAAALVTDSASSIAEAMAGFAAGGRRRAVAHAARARAAAYDMEPAVAAVCQVYDGILPGRF